MDTEDDGAGHGLKGGERHEAAGQAGAIRGDGTAVVSVVGGCGGLCLAQEEGVEFPRVQLRDRGSTGSSVDCHTRGHSVQWRYCFWPHSCKTSTCFSLICAIFAISLFPT